MDIAPNDRPRADNAPGADVHAGQDGGTQTHQGVGTDGDVTAECGVRGNVGALPDGAVVFDDGGGVDDRVGRDARAGVDDRERTDEDSRGDRCAGRDERARVDDRGGRRGADRQTGEDGPSSATIAQAEDPGGRRLWNAGVLEEVYEPAEVGQPVRAVGCGAGGVVVVDALDCPAGQLCCFGDDERVAAAAEECDGVVGTWHG